MPLFQLTNNLSSRYPDISDEFETDPYVFSGKLYVATAASVVNLIHFCEKNVKKVSTPFIVSQGRIDKLIDPNGAFDLLEKSQTRDTHKRLLYYKDAWHDLMHDPVWEANCNRMI